MRLLILSFLFLLSSCGSTQDEYPVVDDPNPLIEEHLVVGAATVTTIKAATSDTIKEADSIKTVATTIENKVPKESKAIVASADNIKKIQSALAEQGTKLEVSNQRLTDIRKDIEELTSQTEAKSKEIKQLKADLQKERDEKQAALFSKLIYLIMTSVILGAVCIVCALRGEVKAFYGAAVCGAVIVISLGISFYAAKLALVGAIALVAGLILVCYMAWKEFESRKATKELVHTVEAAKHKMTPEAKAELFGHGPTVGQAHLLQSQVTKKIVNRLRKAAKEEWEPTIKV